jgi:hypothetical protein
MKKFLHAGLGPKKIVQHLKVEQIQLDSHNPRLPEEAQGQSERNLLEVLYQDFNLDELAFSMAQNGYFDEEPIVVIEKKGGRFVAAEGNRRVATIKVLLDPKKQAELGIRNWPTLDPKVAKDLSTIPAIVYRDRDEVLPYLGVRHIAGIMKWDSYAKARYVANMVNAGYDLTEIQNQIGDKQNSARKHYLCYQLVQQTKNEFDFDIEPAKENFSYLMLATGQGAIKRYIGIPPNLEDLQLDDPVSKEKLPNLKNLFSFIFGEGKKKPSVLGESRDITNFLSHVLSSEQATDFLIRTRDLSAAFELSDGEETMVRRYLASANRRLEAVLGVIHRHKTVDILAEVKKCSETVDRLVSVIGGQAEK